VKYECMNECMKEFKNKCTNEGTNACIKVVQSVGDFIAIASMDKSDVVKLLGLKSERVSFILVRDKAKFGLTLFL